MLKRLGVFFGILILLFIIPISWTAPLRDITVQAVKPLGSALIRQNTSFFNTIQSLRQIGTLRDQNLKLEQQVVTLQQTLADKQTVERENDALRKEVGVTGVTQTTEKALAHIVLISDNPLDRTVTVDIGSAEGIKPDQPAVSQGALVGKVVSVRQHSAVIRLITSNQSRIQVWLSNNREKGLLVGDGNSVLLTNITQGVEVKNDSIVETSGLGGSVPQGILVGETTGLASKKSDLSQSFKVKPAQDPFGIESVFILLTSG
ncbi:MAG: rod shape-determining protein MreC [bacterium]